MKRLKGIDKEIRNLTYKGLKLEFRKVQTTWYCYVTLSNGKKQWVWSDTSITVAITQTKFWVRENTNEGKKKRKRKTKKKKMSKV